MMVHEAYAMAEIDYRQSTMRDEACTRRMRRRARSTRGGLLRRSARSRRR
jgi:hypothetical protein